MSRKLLGRLIGTALMAGGGVSLAVVVVTVIMPLLHAVILPATGPLMGPICPGAPPCI